MNKEIKKINYGVYARKSSEAEDKQALSIESQLDEAEKISKVHGIAISENLIIPESHSAKNPYKRPGFEKMLKEIEGGIIQGIISWHPNRLSRNAIDAARLVDLIDREKLKEIVTHQQVFRNTPSDKFFFALMCSQAKMENDAKGIDVKRGLRKKCKMGYPPGVAKPGYLNDFGRKGERRVMVDPERFPLVKQMFEKYLFGNYSVRRLTKYADEELDLKTVQREHEGGKPLSLSSIYQILKDPFYAGFFYGNDENGDQIRYEAHNSIPRVITEAQHRQIQIMLGRKGRPCPKVNINTFPYVGRTKCGTCGGAVTAEHKYQLICSSCKKKFAYQNKTNCPYCDIKIEKMESPKYLHYIYYHCTKRKTPTCPERCVHEKDIDSFMSNYFENNLQISPALRDWSIKHLNELAQSDKQNEFERRSTFEHEKTKKEKKYERLLDMKLEGEIDDEDFQQKKASLKKEIEAIEKTLTNLGGFDNSAIEKAKKAFNLAVGITEVFRTGTYDEKVEALSEIDTNLTLTDKKFTITTDKLYSIIIKGICEAKATNASFEPVKYEENKERTDNFTSVRSSWLPGSDSNRRPIG